METYSAAYSELEAGISGISSRRLNGISSRGTEYTYVNLGLRKTCSEISKLCEADDANIQLLKYNEIPDFLKWNPYVLRGYRAFLPVHLCYKSVFTWNNETINIWSHLLGFMLFFMFTFYDNLIGIPDLNGTITDHIIITIALFCFQFCLLSSAGYHTFLCHSERSCRQWLSMDLTGISIGLLGCYLPGVHYAFYCLSLWRDIYLIIISLLFGAVLLFQTTPRYLSSEWFYKRLLLYLGLVGYGIIPTIHWVLLNGGLTAKIVQMFLPKVTVMYVLGLLAFLFYITKFPERYFPGKFDYIGSSHQLWHIIVVIVFVWWHSAGRDLMAYRMSEGCLGQH